MILKLKNTYFNNKTGVSNKASFGKKDSKHFIGYKDDKKIDLCAYSLQKMSAYRRDFVYLIVYRFVLLF